MVVQDRVPSRTEPSSSPAPGAGVIEDARSRQRHHRRVGAAVAFAIALIAALVYLDGGQGGGGHGSTAVGGNGPAFVTTASLRLPQGRTTSTILIHAHADHAFDVSVRAPSTAAVVLSTRFGASTGPAFHTLTDRQDCQTVGASTSCVIHFAAGGNAGGTWRWTLTKTSNPAARVQIQVTFNHHRGDYPG